MFLQTQVALLLEKNRKEAKLTKLKKKKKPTIRRKHDDDCFRCGEGGELVMCDRASCTKSYHLSCLGLDKPPYGKHWLIDILTNILNHTSNAKSNRTFTITYIVSSIYTQFYQKLKH